MSQPSKRVRAGVPPFQGHHPTTTPRGARPLSAAWSQVPRMGVGPREIRVLPQPGQQLPVCWLSAGLQGLFPPHMEVMPCSTSLPCESPGPYSKVPQTRQLKQQTFTVSSPGGWNLRSGCEQGYCLLRPLSWACRQPSPPCVPHVLCLCPDLLFL